MSLITPSEAASLMLSTVDLLGIETVALEKSLGRVLREDLSADRPFPPFDRVTMDGVAFRFADLDSTSITSIISSTYSTASHCWFVKTCLTQFATKS